MRTIMHLLAALLLAAGALAGCATANVGKDHVRDPAGTKGLVPGSITYTGQPSGYNVY